MLPRIGVEELDIGEEEEDSLVKAQSMKKLAILVRKKSG